MNEEVKDKEARRKSGSGRLATALLRKSWIMVLAGILAAVITFFGVYYLVTPKYESTVLFYVNNSNVSIGDVSITYADITTRKDLVDTYIVILESRESLVEVINHSGVNRSYRELAGMITASAVNDTEIFEVTVTSENRYEAHSIADAITQLFPTRISGIIQGTSAEVVDHPVVASGSSSPNYITSTIMGLLLGVLLSGTCILLREAFDVTIRSEEDVQQCAPHPILAAVPDMTSQSKGGYYYRDRGKKHTVSLPGDKKPILVGSGISFAASEAYKLLRTKLQFSFVDERDCHIIGVSSALAGEGKSLSSVNLAYSLAQLEKRVLLIDCDMRRPSLSNKLPIHKVPGLSNYLTRQVDEDEVIQKYIAEECSFDVISSGRNPPNPIELLSSQRMKKVLDQLRGSYDYIILDLPPVGEVSDALVAAKLADGILLVVRQAYCSRTALSAAVDQFDFVNSRMLGVVFNCTTDGSGRYGKGYRSYKRYYSRYEGSYSAETKASKRTQDQ